MAAIKSTELKFTQICFSFLKNIKEKFESICLAFWFQVTVTTTVLIGLYSWTWGRNLTTESPHIPNKFKVLK